MANQQLGSFLIEQVESRSAGFGRSIRTTAETLRTIARQLRDDPSTPAAAELAERGADIVDRIGSYLEKSDFEALVADAEDFSRERPWAVASLGVAAGLAASRVLKSTAGRRRALAESELELPRTRAALDPADVGVDTVMPASVDAARRRKRTRTGAANGT